YAIMFFFEIMAPELGASYIGYGIMVLTVPVFPIVLLAMGASDRDAVIYPLRRQFRESADLAKAVEALGRLDELMSFIRYRQALNAVMVLPQVRDEPHHVLIVADAKNPLLIDEKPDYVANAITLDTAGRLLIITGPNS